MSPRRRTSVATARKCSCRNTSAMASTSKDRWDTSVLGHLLERAHLHRAAARRRLGRPRQRAIEVGGLDDPEATELLLGLRERPVGDDYLTVTEPYDGRGAYRVQPSGKHPRSGRTQLRVEGLDVPVGLLHHLR